jgi:hypothetical protein
MVFDVVALKKFYDYVSIGNGIPTEQVNAELSNLFSMPRSEEDKADFRIAKNPWKKLRDEICPVLKFLSSTKRNGLIKFPLNDQKPDAWFTPYDGVVRLGIEVTIAQGHGRYHLMKELNETGWGRGFTALADGQNPPADFNETMSREREPYSTGQALSAVKSGVLRCLEEKNKPEYQGMVLLIEAVLTTMARDNWGSMFGELNNKAKQLPFCEVFLLGHLDSDQRIFQLK